MSTLQIHHLASRASQVWADGVRAPRPNRATTSPASNVTHYEFGPFAELIRATGPMAKLNPFRFSTKYQDDETDLIYYGYRYYNASTGRWLSRDPIAEKGGLNLYASCENDPVNDFDSLGNIGYYFDVESCTLKVTLTYTLEFKGKKWAKHPEKEQQWRDKLESVVEGYFNNLALQESSGDFSLAWNGFVLDARAA